MIHVNIDYGAAAVTLPLLRSLRSPLRALRDMLADDSGQALVEYCIVMGTLSVLMMLAFRNVGAIANAKAATDVNNLTNSSINAP